MIFIQLAKMLISPDDFPLISKGDSLCNNGVSMLRYLCIDQCDKLSEVGNKYSSISDGGSVTICMDIFGHIRAVEFFKDHNIMGEGGGGIFSYANREGVALVLFNTTKYYINDLYKLGLVISMMHGDEESRVINNNASKVKSLNHFF